MEGLGGGTVGAGGGASEMFIRIQNWCKSLIIKGIFKISMLPINK